MSVDLLLTKLAEIRTNPSCKAFLLADARDADMSWGIPSFGKARSGTGFRSVPAFLDEIRAVVRQGFIDVLLASGSTMDVLAHKEQIFEGSHVTPAVRINDATDIWCQRGANGPRRHSRPLTSRKRSLAASPRLARVRRSSTWGCIR
jgi:hypothetical protein